MPNTHHISVRLDIAQQPVPEEKFAAGKRNVVAMKIIFCCWKTAVFYPTLVANHFVYITFLNLFLEITAYESIKTRYLKQKCCYLREYEQGRCYIVHY